METEREMRSSAGWGLEMRRKEIGLSSQVRAQGTTKAFSRIDNKMVTISGAILISRPVPRRLAVRHGFHGAA